MGTLYGNSYGNLYGILYGSSSQDDEDLQDILDPGDNFTGIRIIRRNDAVTVTSYYVVPVNLEYRGRSRWVDTGINDSNTTKAATIRAALLIPYQHDAGTV